MKIQTYSVLVGSAACNASCPYCVSKMTPRQGVSLKVPEVDWRNFEIGCRFAKDSRVSTVLLTSKGEPTLFESLDQITDFLEHLLPYNFPFIELQTNGIKLFQEKEEYVVHLKRWYGLGLTMVAISIVHYENEINRKNFQPNGSYMDLVGLISYLHSFGFSVRLSCVMFRGAIDSVKEVKNLVSFAKENEVEQLTITPVRALEESASLKVTKWVSGHQLSVNDQVRIKCFLGTEGKKLLSLMHGAAVYDLDGQNICLSDCLTISSSPEEVRQLIFFPDGHLKYDWQYEGAILL